MYSKSFIKTFTRLIRKITFGTASNHKGYPIDLPVDVMSGLGIRILYTDSRKFSSITLYNTKLNRPTIIISRKLSPNVHSYKRFFAISRELGNLFLFWHYQPQQDLSKSAYRFLKKHHQIFNKQNYILNVSPDNDNPEHEKEMNLFAKYFLNK